jgi:PTS system nitrogen regulatory IIA component
MEEQKPKIENDLIDLIARGGVLYQVPGTTPKEIITGIVETIRLPAALLAEPPASATPVSDDPKSAGLLVKPTKAEGSRLLDAVLEREALMPTAVGCGIALPHPRNPLITEIGDQFVTIAFLQQPVDWHSLDGEPVHTVILIVSASPRLHLGTLSRLNFFCQQERFRALLAARAPQEEIIALIRKAEAAWE